MANFVNKKYTITPYVKLQDENERYLFYLYQENNKFYPVCTMTSVRIDSIYRMMKIRLGNHQKRRSTVSKFRSNHHLHYL